jgi:hypothetical protein
VAAVVIIQSTLSQEYETVAQKIIGDGTRAFEWYAPVLIKVLRAKLGERLEKLRLN